MLVNGWAVNAVVVNGGIEGIAPHSGEPGSGRYVSDAEVERILTKNFGVWPRVWVADAFGVMRDYSTRDQLDWAVAVEMAGDIDAPISTATVKLWREHLPTLRSLAPLRSDSVYNVDGPAINAGRRIQIDVACPALGATPTEDDYRIVFQGYVDSVDWAANPMTLECRDLGAQIQDMWFQSPNFIGTDEATEPIQQAIADLLERGRLTVHVPLYVPLAPDPDVEVGIFSFAVEPVMTAVQRLAQVNGWDLRYRFADEFGEFRFTFKDPGRLKTEPDFTLWPYSLIDIKQIKIDRTQIRNEVTVGFRPDNDLGNDRDQRTASDGVSANKYGVQSMVIQEDDTSPINTAELAQLMADLIVFDLAEPKADKIVELPYCWFLELQNLIRFPSNDVTHDGDLDLAIVSYRHVINQSQSRTTLTTRGSPAGDYWQWTQRRPVRPVDVPESDAMSRLFSDLAQTPDYATDHIVFSFTWNGPALGDINPSAYYGIQVQTSAIGPFSSTINLGTDTFYDFTLAEDIEPFDTPSDSHPQTVQISFRAVVAIPAFGADIIAYRSSIQTVTYRVVA